MGKDQHSARRWGNKNSSRPRVVEEVSEEVALMRQATSLLNRITPENIDKLSSQLVSLELDESGLGQVIHLIFEKAVLEPKYCNMYADLCLFLHKQCPTPADQKHFRGTLINLCQEEFQRRSQLSASDDPDALRQACVHRLRMRGNMELVGGLYKHGLLNEKLLGVCFSELLGGGDPVDLEAFTMLMASVGSRYSATNKGGLLLPGYFAKVGVLKEDAQLPSRVRFMLQDLVELRRNKWQPRTRRTEAVTLEQARKEVEEIQEASREKADRQAPRRERGRGGRHSSHSGRERGKDSRERGAAHKTIKDAKKRESRNPSGRGDNSKRRNQRDGKRSTATAPRDTGASKRLFGSAIAEAGSKKHTQNHQAKSATSESPEKEPAADLPVPEAVDEADLRDEKAVLLCTEQVENLWEATIREYEAQGDLEEAVVSVSEMRAAYEDEEGLQCLLMVGAMRHLVKHSLSEKVVQLMEALCERQVLGCLEAGVGMLVKEVDDLTEEFPAAPHQIGVALAHLYPYFQYGIFSLRHGLPQIESLNAAALLVGSFRAERKVLAGDSYREAQFQFDSKYTTRWLALQLEDVIKRATPAESLEWAKQHVQDKTVRKDPAFVRAIMAGMSRQFPRSWTLPGTTTEECAAEKHLFDSYLDLISMFAMAGRSAQIELISFITKLRDDGQRARVSSYFPGLIV